MKISRLLPSACALSLTATLFSCEDKTSEIGPGLVQGEVIISVDSAEFQLSGHSVETGPFDSRATFNLIGRLSAPEYGELSCSFLGRLMSAYNFPVPDSIPANDVDSVVLFMSVPRGYLTGDSLAPQQVTVYRLNRQLPNDIKNNFDPTGYYDPSDPLGSRSYTLSEISSSDSVFTNSSYIHVRVTLPRQLGVDAFNAYRSNPEIFQWPDSFAKYFPGIYVEPSFGRGCVAGVAGLNVYTFYHHQEERKVTVDSVTTTKLVTIKDSVNLFSLSPEALNSNNISYKVSQQLKDKVASGEVIITTPGGYAAEITFPAQYIVEKYLKESTMLKVVNDLTFSIGATGITNDFGIQPCPYMLLIKKSEMEDFFANNKIPDSKTSFWAKYDSTNGRYDFSSMRNYIIDLIDKGGATEEDETFMLIPVLINTESVTNSYTGVVTTYVTGCEHYLARPTMTRILTDKANIIFTYSRQTID